MIPYWECTYHKCGSSKFNNLARHEMPWCQIEKREGNLKQNTWHDPVLGGFNGDVSRKFYRDWDKYCLERQQQTQKKENWARQLSAHEDFIEDITERRNRRSYFDKRR